MKAKKKLYVIQMPLGNTDLWDSTDGFDQDSAYPSTEFDVRELPHPVSYKASTAVAFYRELADTIEGIVRDHLPSSDTAIVVPPQDDRGHSQHGVELYFVRSETDEERDERVARDEQRLVNQKRARQEAKQQTLEQEIAHHEEKLAKLKAKLANVGVQS